jgi:hypothetical protein
MTTPSHLDRRNARSEPLEFTLTEDTLVWRTQDGRWGGEMRFDRVQQVRLAVEIAGRASQVVCRVTDIDGREAVFGSMRWAGPGHWEPAADTFQVLLRGLHASLLPRAALIRFVEGQSLAFTTTMFGLGLILAVAGAAFFVILFLVQENPLGLVLIAAIAAGGWLMRLFRPRGPRVYDPRTYAAAGLSETPPDQ